MYCNDDFYRLHQEDSRGKCTADYLQQAWIQRKQTSAIYMLQIPETIIQHHKIGKHYTLLELKQKMANQSSQPGVLTIGHSTLSLEEFIDLLKTHAIKSLIDIRSVPRSRHNPQFNGDTLPIALELAGIRYTHATGLGGFPRASPESPNTGWRNVSFRGFADYMQTAEFAENLAALLERATHERVALMCAEAVPWRCHRSLIADALLVHGNHVEEIISRTRLQSHALSSFAKIDDMTITYPFYEMPHDSGAVAPEAQ